LHKAMHQLLAPPVKCDMFRVSILRDAVVYW